MLRGEAVDLPPMGSFQRFVIHDYFKDRQGVRSESYGRRRGPADPDPAAIRQGPQENQETVETITGRPHAARADRGRRTGFRQDHRQNPQALGNPGRL
ncbi:MAG: hypothetical protein MZU84_02280 [Sphingobacterium sp.]|nr:hypothetical protein [Sphingobacterium sp.]